MVADWTATLDALLASGDFEADAVGYDGLSGGCLFGLPYVASDRRIIAAVVGACGYEGVPLLADAPSTFAPVLRDAAQRYDRPVLFPLQADDDMFPASGGRALFADLASSDKRLLVSPGTHTEVPLSTVDEMTNWLADRLGIADSAG
jgi:dienelactone hydrolase